MISILAAPPIPSLPQLLGPAVARAALLESAGYKVVSVPQTEWAALKDANAKAAYVLNAVKAAAPGVKVRALRRLRHFCSSARKYM